MPIRILLPLAAFYLFWALIVTAPLISQGGTALIGLPTDAWLNIYTLHYLHQFLFSGLDLASGFLDGLIFFGHPYSLGLTETLFGVLPLYSLLFTLSHDPILSYNLLLIVALVLNATSATYTSYSLTSSVPAAALAGTVFGFSPIAIGQMGHLQLLCFWWSPLSILFLVRYCREKKLTLLGVSLLLFVLQFASSIYLGNFLLTILFVLGVAEGGVSTFWHHLKRKPAIALTLITCFLALMLLVVSPYIVANSHYKVTRSITENSQFSASLWSFITAPRVNLLASSVGLPQHNPERELFLGFSPLLLAALGARSCLSLSIALITVLIFSFGPYASIGGAEVPLPYSGALTLIYPFRAMRVPARWGMAYLLIASLLGAYGAKKLFSRFSHAALLLVAPLLLLEQLSSGLELAPASLNSADMALVDTLQRGEGGVLFWPALEVDAPTMHGVTVGTLRSAKRSVLATLFKRPIVNGYSGYTPPGYEELIREGRRLPRRAFHEKLRKMGVTTIVDVTRLLNKEHRPLCGKRAETIAGEYMVCNLS